MTANLVCSVASHNALRADLSTWRDIPIRGLSLIDSEDGDPAEVWIDKVCPACSSNLSQFVPLVGDLAAVWETLQRCESAGGPGVDLRYACRRALDGCPLALRQWRNAVEMTAMMGGAL